MSNALSRHNLGTGTADFVVPGDDSGGRGEGGGGGRDDDCVGRVCCSFTTISTTSNSFVAYDTTEVEPNSQ